MITPLLLQLSVAQTFLRTAVVDARMSLPMHQTKSELRVSMGNSFCGARSRHDVLVPCAVLRVLKSFPSACVALQTVLALAQAVAMI